MIELHLDSQFEDLAPKIRYVLDLFESNYRVERPVRLAYGNMQGKSGIHVPAGEEVVPFFSSSRQIPSSFCWFSWKDRKLPAFFCDRVKTPLVQTHNGWKSAFDVLMSAFFFLCSWDEIHSLETDGIERFPAQRSFLYQQGLMDVPIVNYYFELLADLIEKGTGIRPKRSRRFSVSITHDVDRCRTGWRENSYRAFKKGKIFLALKTILHRIFGKDIWFNFDEILDIEKKLQIQSTFFFFGLDRPDLSVAGDYTVHSRRMKKVLRKIRENGHEIGVHASKGTAEDVLRLKQETEGLGGEVFGNRYHFLAFRIPSGFETIEKAGLLYDSSLGFAESAGFRSGLCFPYQPYNLREERPYHFIEFPLVIMDRTFTNYLKVEPKVALASIERVLCEVERFQGHLTLLWHNSYFSGFKFGLWKNVFIEIIQQILARKAVIKPLNLFAREWKGNE